MKDRFVLTSQWQLGCSAAEVWAVLDAVCDWPRWWPQVLHSTTLHEGLADGTGKVIKLVWRTPLLYRLDLQLTRTRALPPLELEGAAEGDLSGRGLWLLDPQADGSVLVTYRWDIRLARPWMRYLAPLLRPVFAWSHFQVMRSGAQGMARHLGCALSEYRDLSPRSTKRSPGQGPRHA